MLVIVISLCELADTETSTGASRRILWNYFCLDLMELMLIQNAQMQQWMMTQTLQRRQGEDGHVHNHYYDAQGRPLPPIRR